MKSYETKSNGHKNKYDFTNCKPLGEYTTNDINVLEQIYRLKLKKSGFNDIEKWKNSSPRAQNRQHQVKFIKGHIRWNTYKTKEIFHRLQNETFNYYRVLGLFSHHAKEKILPEKYREVLQLYAMNGNLSKSIKLASKKVIRCSMMWYIVHNFDKMVLFVQEEFKDD